MNVRNLDKDNKDLIVNHHEFNKINRDEYENVVIQSIVFKNIAFSKHNFKKTIFNKCIFENCVFENSHFFITRFHECQFIKCDFNQLDVKGGDVLLSICSFMNSSLKNSTLFMLNLKDSNFTDCDFDSSHINRCNFENTSFSKTNFSSTKITETYLLNTKWIDVVFNQNTEFRYSKFSDPNDNRRKHDVLNDRSESVKFIVPYNCLNWKNISKIGKLPMLEFSWSLFAFCIFIISSIVFLNQTKFISSGIVYDIPVPYQLIWTTFGALFASIGAILYRSYCPDRIQNFTEAQWVEELGHPRIFYREYWAKNTVFLWTTALSLFAGAGILLGLITLRIYNIIIYFIN